jgi:hypothetical protein
VHRITDPSLTYLHRAHRSHFLPLSVIDANVQVGALLKGRDLDLDMHAATVGPRLDMQCANASFAWRQRRVVGVEKADFHSEGDYIVFDAACHVERDYRVRFPLPLPIATSSHHN